MFKFKQFLEEAYSNILVEAVSNDDKGKLLELLHARHMHPKKTLPTHYRDEESGKTPEQVHNAIQGRISQAEYDTIDRHARESAEAMKAHLRSQGHNPDHITHVAWTSNGASDVAKFTGEEDPHNDSDVMYRLKHPKKGTYHVGVGLKYGSQAEPNLRNPGLDSLEKMTGATTLLTRFKKHKKKLASLGYKDTAEQNHIRWKKEKDSTRGKAANESKLQTTRAMAGDIYGALAKKDSNGLREYIRGIVAPKTKSTVFRMHTQTSDNNPGASASHHIDEPSKDIDEHLSQFSELKMDKPGKGISVTIKGTNKAGKTVNVLSHAVKGVSGPMKGLAATTKLPGYRPGKKKNK